MLLPRRRARARPLAALSLMATLPVGIALLSGTPWTLRVRAGLPATTWRPKRVVVVTSAVSQLADANAEEELARGLARWGTTPNTASFDAPPQRAAWLHRDPPMLMVHNFLSDDECDAIIEEVEVARSLGRSRVAWSRANKGGPLPSPPPLSARRVPPARAFRMPIHHDIPPPAPASAFGFAGPGTHDPRREWRRRRRVLALPQRARQPRDERGRGCGGRRRRRRLGRGGGADRGERARAG